jgi:hypothetical protein
MLNVFNKEKYTRIRRQHITAYVLCLNCIAISVALANEVDFNMSARYRLQNIDDPAQGDATASTVKLRFDMDWIYEDKFETFLQADVVYAFNPDSYNSVAITRATSPIPDVPSRELNQAWFKYSSNNNWFAVLGRQIINFDNERQVSSVEFWQNDQTYGAVSFVYNDSTHWQINYSYLTKVHRIFSDDATKVLPTEDIRFDGIMMRPFLELGNHDHNSHLLNVNYRYNRYLAITGYAYLLDNKTASQLSSNTIGLRFSGEIKPDTIKYKYSGEFALQETVASSPWDYRGYYALVEMGAQYKSHELTLGYEVLSENNGFAFATSLGNNHKFLGWADIFSSYLNNDGIRDYYLSYRGRNAKLRWNIAGHRFDSDSSRAIIGYELDTEVAYRINRQWEVTFLQSLYFTDSGLTGVEATQTDLKSWTLSLSYNF